MATTIVYTLKQNPTSEEYHLFPGTMTNVDHCSVESTSLCGKMEKQDMEKENKFACADEMYARKACADIGRQVCGVCISKLYWTEDEE